MTINEAKKICMEIDLECNNLRWNEIYSSEAEIVSDLEMIYIPKNRTAIPYTFTGYTYIYSFAYYVQRGWTLSEKQMAQAKRLAKEIKKAAAISACVF